MSLLHLMSSSYIPTTIAIDASTIGRLTENRFYAVQRTPARGHRAEQKLYLSKQAKRGLYKLFTKNRTKEW
jgi:hypothetical protein